MRFGIDRRGNEDVVCAARFRRRVKRWKFQYGFPSERVGDGGLKTDGVP